MKKVVCNNHREVAAAIKDMVTQSAGPYVAAAMGMALAAHACAGRSETDQIDYLTKAAHTISHARPTTTWRMQKITEEMLRSGRACLYSVSSYSVEEKIDNETLLVTLTAPDGNIYHYESGWYYDPAIMERDEWYTTLDNTGLLEMLNRNGYPRGTYELSMYIDGKCADSFTFDLTE